MNEFFDEAPRSGILTFWLGMLLPSAALTLWLAPSSWFPFMSKVSADLALVLIPAIFATSLGLCGAAFLSSTNRKASHLMAVVHLLYVWTVLQILLLPGTAAFCSAFMALLQKP